MKKLSKSILIIILLFTAATASANALSSNEKVGVIREYLHDLQTANASAITGLFVPGGEVISTSQGRVNASGFFNSFLPEIASAEVSIHKIYNGFGTNEGYSASFHFSWIMNDGSQSGGNYVDEFIFEKGTNKLVAVYMYENLKM